MRKRFNVSRQNCIKFNHVEIRLGFVGQHAQSQISIDKDGKL